MASRDLKDLTPSVSKQALTVRQLFDKRAPVGVTLLIYCTYRSPQEQARLFRQGRSLAQIEARALQLEDKYRRPDLTAMLRNAAPQAAKRRVTNAGPGQSIHQYRGAFDAAPIRDGAIVWGTKDPADAALWALYGDVVLESALEWAGNWRRGREFPHAQSSTLDWHALIREGAAR